MTGRVAHGRPFIFCFQTSQSNAFVDQASGRLIGSSRYYGYEPELSEIEIGWTFLARVF